MTAKRTRKYLLLTLDAYETLFHPRLPIATQYAQTARSLGVFNPLPTHLRPSESDLKTAFKEAFKHEAKLRPNYGRLQPDFTGGPAQWWGNVIKGSFERAVLSATQNFDSDPAVNENKHHALESLPPELIPRLLERFSSREAYELYQDVDPFFRALRAWKDRIIQGNGHGNVPFEQIIVGVVSNSDDRVPDILRSLGLKIGGSRAETTTAASQTATEVSGTADFAKPSGPENDIDFVITSYEAGEEKPHRQIFDVAKHRGKTCKRVDEPRNTAENSQNEEIWAYVHVGDDEEKDYRGAINAGWGSFFLDRSTDGRSLGYESPDMKRINSLAELLPRLGFT